MVQNETQIHIALLLCKWSAVKQSAQWLSQAVCLRAKKCAKSMAHSLNATERTISSLKTIAAVCVLSIRGFNEKGFQ